MRRAVELLDKPITSLGNERYHALVLGGLAKDIRDAPDKGLREWYVRMYGFSIAELTGFMKRFIVRMQNAPGRKDFDARWGASEAAKKANDVAYLTDQQLKIIKKRKKP